MTATTNQRIAQGKKFDRLRAQRIAFEQEFFQTNHGYDPNIKEYVCVLIMQNTMMEQNIKQIQEHLHFLHLYITQNPDLKEEK